MNAEDLRMSRFADVESSDFTITVLTSDGAVAIKVTASLQSLTPRATTPDYEQYAMRFIGPVQPLLPQGTYRFSHATLGDLLLFMVPVGQDVQGTQYEVCVTRKLT